MFVSTAKPYEATNIANINESGLVFRDIFLSVVSLYWIETLYMLLIFAYGLIFFLEICLFWMLTALFGKKVTCTAEKILKWAFSQIKKLSWKVTLENFYASTTEMHLRE